MSVTTETHIAGPAIEIPPRLRQRCAWCGAVLDDYDVTAVAVEEGQDPRLPTWPEGALVRRDGAARMVVEPEDGKLPLDTCALLDPEVTS